MQKEGPTFPKCFYNKEPPIVPESLKDDFVKFYIEIYRRLRITKISFPLNSPNNKAGNFSYLRFMLFLHYFNMVQKGSGYWNQMYLNSNLGSATKYQVTKHLAFPEILQTLSKNAYLFEG